eukprot:3384859-Pyramimonas_sp.AAC.1
MRPLGPVLNRIPRSCTELGFSTKHVPCEVLWYDDTLLKFSEEHALARNIVHQGVIPLAPGVARVEKLVRSLRQPAVL